MGMYTELIFGAQIKNSIPECDLNALKYLFEGGDLPATLPAHAFFTCDRWKWITTGSSYYFAVLDPHRSIRYDDISESWVCSSRANIKNYANEIELFLDWIKPYIEQGSGNREFYAIVCYEESSEPTVYYLHDNDVIVIKREIWNFCQSCMKVIGPVAAHPSTWCNCKIPTLKKGAE